MKGRLLRVLAFLALMVTPAPALKTRSAVILVTTSADAGAGSLRQALLDSNASVGVRDEIEFNIPGAGVHTIFLSSALPDITDPVVIKGQTQPGVGSFLYIELDGSGIPTPDAVLTVSAGNSEIYALVINRGPDAGVRIRTNGGNTIGACFIGVDLSNPAVPIARGNATHGIVIENVGGNRLTSLTYGNVIAGNGAHGVLITGVSATSNSIEGNNSIGIDLIGSFIGNGGFGVLVIDGNSTTITSTTIRGNAAGGVSFQGALSSAIVDGNYIYGNGGPGVSVYAPASGATIRNNVSYGNTGLAIDLGGDGPTPNDPGDVDGGANLSQNYPVLTELRFVHETSYDRQVSLIGRLESAPSTTYQVEFYQSDRLDTNEPQVTLTAVHTAFNITTDANGVASFSEGIQLLDGMRFVTAIARDPAGNTSEFAPALEVMDLEVDSGVCGATGLEVFCVVALLALRRAAARRR